MTRDLTFCAQHPAETNFRACRTMSPGLCSCVPLFRFSLFVSSKRQIGILNTAAFQKNTETLVAATTTQTTNNCVNDNQCLFGANCLRLLNPQNPQSSQGFCNCFRASTTGLSFSTPHGPRCGQRSLCNVPNVEEKLKNCTNACVRLVRGNPCSVQRFLVPSWQSMRKVHAWN